MAVFDQAYYASNHAAEEYIRRFDNDIPTPETIKKTKRMLPNIVASGDIIIEFREYRYVRNVKAFFPCVQVEGGKYLIRTTMRWSDVEPRLQEIVDLYSRESEG
ncbi:hypothetical protein DFP93_101211 [Aneurinibacillus soli]|uniref:Uncharacterized protein n=1 Tax=Aneurinibacillus soli TaxID=1500254 RepID=A0A0U5BD63_9BACL|nr:hypothetical protein [Aneurinibacillus soli]PYE64186.1 hypothetical protein DFP93_101211 [Aneurinibacillus soli]BAU28135.1 hypothetical protein CB4_02309 [Aneurinibacillus soli]